MELYFTGHSDDKSVALFDLDESLGAVLPNLMRVTNEHYGTKLVYEDVTDFVHFSEVVGVPKEEILALFNSHGLDKLFHWYENAGEFVLRVRNGYVFDEQCHIALVTSRGNFWKNSVGHTLKQINSNLIPYDSIAILDFHMDKIEWAKETYGDRLRYVFEDAPKALHNSFTSGIKTFKNVTPYNGHCQTHGEFCATKNIIKMY